MGVATMEATHSIPPPLDVPPAMPDPTGTSLASDLWRMSLRIGQDSSHPARRWIERRGLYWPAPLPLPSGARWVPGSAFAADYPGAGAVIVAFASPESWTEAWPSPPLPTSVDLLHLDEQGLPALDRPFADGGASTRSHGPRRGAVGLLGDPRPNYASGLMLVDSFLNALPLAARFPETVAFVTGPDAPGGVDLPASWLALWHIIRACARDPDAEIDGSLQSALAEQGPRVTLCSLEQLYEEPTAFRVEDSLASVNLSAARELAADLEKEGLPRWEAARLALMTVPVDSVEG